MASPKATHKSSLMSHKSWGSKRLSAEAVTQKRKSTTVNTSSSMSKSHGSDKEKFDDTIPLQQINLQRYQLRLPGGWGFEELSPFPVLVQVPRAPSVTQQPVKNQALGRTAQRIQPMYTPEECSQWRREIPSLKHAMGVLHREIDNAIAFYKSFKDGFDTETHELKSYMPKDKLDDIWTERVHEKCQVEQPDPSAFSNTEASQDNEPPAHQPKCWKGFVDTQRNVIRSADEVLDSLDLSRKRAADHSSQIHTIPAKHFREKVSFAIEQAKELMELAMLSPDACAALSRELESLKELVNPRSETLKELYKSRGLEDESWSTVAQGVVRPNFCWKNRCETRG